MEIYLVGGAVRDQLLGLPIQERDYVVVGATPEIMLEKGFKPVGKEFPVFLHPETHEEYALARTERKVGKGYKGFTFYTSPQVSLEEDLRRRDLTINAMAQSIDGKIIDPYGGQHDLKQKLLHHVSPAFAEDPVRILRVARFAARFSQFEIHPETLQLMKNMVLAGEVNALVPERVWQELEKALTEKTPQRFFQVLQQCDALAILFPEFNAESFALLQKAAEKSADLTVRFAAMFNALNADQTQKLCGRFRIPNEYRDLALIISRFYQQYSTLKKADAEVILHLLEASDAFRRHERFEKFLTVCEIISAKSENAEILRKAYKAAVSVSVKDISDDTVEPAGKEIAVALRNLRLERIGKIM